MRVSGRVWKALGVAGVAGIAATGVVVARDRRRRIAVTPDEVRERLHDRLARAEGSRAVPEVGTDSAQSAQSAQSAR